MSVTQQFIDPIYGKITFDDPTLIQIIDTKIFQRLKSIAQNGLYGLIRVSCLNNGLYPTRFEHSLGTAFICQLLNTSVEVQIFALLHDLYHTHFSHDTDYLSNELESLHEKNKENFFSEMDEMNELILILSEKNKNWKTFFDSNLLPSSQIVKNKQLGADNIDYILRDGYYHNLISKQWVQQFLPSLRIDNGQIVCRSELYCQSLMHYSLTVDQKIYNGADNKGCNILMGKILKRSLSKQIITEKQLFYGYQTDQQLLQIITHSGDPLITQLLDQLHQFGFYYSSQPLSNNDATIKLNLSIRCRFLNPWGPHGGDPCQGLNQWMQTFECYKSDHQGNPSGLNLYQKRT